MANRILVVLQRDKDRTNGGFSLARRGKQSIQLGQFYLSDRDMGITLGLPYCETTHESANHFPLIRKGWYTCHQRHELITWALRNTNLCVTSLMRPRTRYQSSRLL